MAYVTEVAKNEILRQLAASGPFELGELQTLCIEQVCTCKRDVLCTLIDLNIKGYVVQYEAGGAYDLTDAGYALADKILN
jgi:hypothetical protein